MRVVNTGNVFRIYDNTMKTYNELPARAYQVNFNQQSGFFLTGYDEISVNEKVYGVHMSKVAKVLKSFELFERNLGVILSGAKGIGKSLFGKILSVEGIAAGYPLIIVNQYIPGIADYLTSIQQEVIVFFDEFDKTFYSKNDRDSINDPQSEMLTLFDGLSQGKKLFIVTCNELNNLNNYLVNRPGRFHYHFRFDYPSAEEIREYLEDKIPESAYGQIDRVIAFARKIDLNYDCLRAIAFELTLGVPFEDAIKDLNILNLSRESYIATVMFADGGKCRKEIYCDMFVDEDLCVEFTDEKGFDFYITFNPQNVVYNYEKGGTIISGSECEVDWQDDYYDGESDQKALAIRKQRVVDYIVIRRKGTKNLHYTV